jgi:hypothetical protein
MTIFGQINREVNLADALHWVAKPAMNLNTFFA